MKLTHPDAPKSQVDPKEEHAGAYLSQGWVPVEPEADKGADKAQK